MLEKIEFGYQGFLQLNVVCERKNEESLHLKGIAVEVCETKRFQHLSCSPALPEAADNPAIFPCRTDSVEFCMTLNLSGVSKMKVT